MESTIWLEVQILKNRMSKLYSVLAEKVKNPYTKTTELPNLAATAESIAINILKLESASITAIKQSNTLLENHIKIQLPSRFKFEGLPKIMYSNPPKTYSLERDNSIDTKKNTITFND